MNDKYIFREMLGEIKKLADEQEGILTLEEVKDFFANTHLEPEQLDLICEYLLSQKISVTDYQSEATKAEIIQPEEEKEEETFLEEENFIQMYLKDLEDIIPASEEEELALFQKALAGDELAKSRLVELHLRMVYELSITYCCLELSQSDLIQEGNIALLLAMNHLAPESNLKDFQENLFEEIQKAMEDALEDAQNLHDMDGEMIGRANHLQEAVKNLAEELGRKVSLEELSVYLEMPIEEIKDIMRMSADSE